MNRICLALFIGDHFDSCYWVFLIIKGITYDRSCNEIAYP